MCSKGKGVVMPSHSESDEDGSFQEAAHGNIDAGDVRAMVFDTEEDAHAFYMQYSRQMGFGIRKRDMRRGKDQSITMRKWVCAKEGERDDKWLNLVNRKRKAKAETRENCPAMFRVKFDRAPNKWIVTHFVSEHNHPLVKTEHVKFLKAHRHMTEGDVAQSKAMRMVGVKTSQIYDLLANQRGGYANLSFTPKDMHNFINKVRKEEVLDGDVQRTFGYFAAKQGNDPTFFFDYDTTENNELGSLFWADSTCRADYACFGDVLAFDAAYKRNVYNKPLVILVGVNNHHQSIIFGCALLQDESAGSYIWLLNKFLKCMGDKKPFSVVTDGDRAMRSAIKHVLPNATHRLCIWHLERNATCHSQGPRFLDDFIRVMVDRMEADEFERVWFNFVDKYNLHNNDWAIRLYGDRELWAEAYLKDKFFAGVRSTSRCEGMHSFMNRFLNKQLKLHEFVVQFDSALSKIRQNEAEAEHSSTYSTPVCKYSLKNYESQAAGIYTMNSFIKFQDELWNENAYVQECPPIVEGDFVTYRLHRLGRPNRV